MTKKVFSDATMEDGKLYFDKRAAADIEVFDTLEDLKTSMKWSDRNCSRTTF